MIPASSLSTTNGYIKHATKAHRKKSLFEYYQTVASKTYDCMHQFLVLKMIKATHEICVIIDKNLGDQSPGLLRLKI